MTGTQRLSLFVAFMALLSAIVFLPHTAAAAPRAELVADAQTGRIMYGQNINNLRHPASLTKIMTLYLTFAALEQGRIRLDDTITISEHATSMPASKLGLSPGDRLRVKDAILALVTLSANDIAVALGEYLGGSEGRFAQVMTQQAKALGMKRTVYQNASGLHDPDQVTTAFDQAILARAMMYHFPREYAYFKTRAYTYEGVTHRNHNRLMSRYSGMDGIKTGYIGPSGFNLVASARRDGRRLIGVVFGGRSAVTRDNRMAEILNHGFRQMVAENSKTPATTTPVLYAANDTARTAAAVPNADPIGEGDEQLESDRAPAKMQDAKKWAVQVGTFKNQRKGLSAIASAKRRASAVLKGATASVIKARNGRHILYRARFTGLSEKEARDACSSLTQAGHSCLTLPPRG